MEKTKKKSTVLRVEFLCDSSTEFEFASDLLRQWQLFKENERWRDLCAENNDSAATPLDLRRTGLTLTIDGAFHGILSDIKLENGSAASPVPGGYSV